MTGAGAPALGIVIPHLNQPDFLLRCLQSLAPQIEAHPSVELIVVDNGSRQLPHDVCNRFSFVRLEQESEPGPGPARNRGIACCRADLLAFIDADCVAHRGWLASIFEAFASRPDMEIIGGDVRIGLADPKRMTMLEAYECVFAYRQREYIEKMGFSGTGNLAMRRSAYERVGAFAGIAVAEDRDWGQRAAAIGLHIIYVPEMIVDHPARKTFGELQRKWDRHVSHDFAEWRRGALGIAGWVAKSLAVGASGLIDIRRVIASRRIASWRERGLASIVLMRIRLYRMWRMLSLLQPGRRADSQSWNRSP